MRMSKAAVTVALVASLIEPVSAQSKPETTVLFQGLRIFDGKGASLSDAGATIVNGDGRTLMPGLIDNHAHLTFWTLPFALMTTADPNYLQVRQAATAKEFLMAGYTSAM